MASKGVLFLQYNAPNLKLREINSGFLLQQGFTLLEHFSYSPNLAPSNYYLILKLKKVRRLVRKKTIKN